MNSVKYSPLHWHRSPRWWSNMKACGKSQTGAPTDICPCSLFVHRYRRQLWLQKVRFDWVQRLDPCQLEYIRGEWCFPVSALSWNLYLNIVNHRSKELKFTPLLVQTFLNITCENVLAEIDTSRCLANTATGDMENTIKYIWMPIVKPNPKGEKENWSATQGSASWRQ